MRAGALTLAVTAFISTAAPAQMVGGDYQVHGTNPDGSGYSGTATITPKSDTTCRITWDTGSTSSGICMVAAQSLAASYALGDKIGLVLYQLQPDGSLKGSWTIVDQPGAGSETLTPAK